jgi:hypothetical protein
MGAQHGTRLASTSSSGDQSAAHCRLGRVAAGSASGARAMSRPGSRSTLSTRRVSCSCCPPGVAADSVANASTSCEATHADFNLARTSLAGMMVANSGLSNSAAREMIVALMSPRASSRRASPSNRSLHAGNASCEIARASAVLVSLCSRTVGQTS